mmetsp:Transcript_43663/g.129245  ORF Transcript_43663/g.129245 Transcript_43663/m.129245 type:complete len:555 (+) Transcript_43663:1-1665(+)
MTTTVVQTRSMQAAWSPKVLQPQKADPEMVKKVLLLYTGSADDVTRVARTLYAESATFEGPLVRVHGRDNVAAQFLALRALVSSTSIRDVKVTEEPGRLVLQYAVWYHLTRFMGTLTAAQTTTLVFDKNGAVQAHVDEWDHPIGLLAVLPWPWCYLYDVWRFFLGRVSSTIVLVALGCVDSICDMLSNLVFGCMACASDALDSLVPITLRSHLSACGIVSSLIDARGIVDWAWPSPSEGAFQDATAIIVGDLGIVSQQVVGHIVRGGASAVHLVSSSEASSSKPLLETACVGLQEQHPSTVVKHRVDFLNPIEVAQWCKTQVQRMTAQGQRANIVVLGSVAVVPKRQRFTNEALEQAFASDVVALQALLAGLSPILAPGARVVVSASASCCWLSRLSPVALGSSGPGGSGARLLDVCAARACQQGARVVLASHQARKWAAEEEGPVCVSCSPTACWSAWTDLLAWAGLLDTSRSLVGYIPFMAMFVTWAEAVVSARVAGTLVHLCSQATHVVPGEYYWGKHRVRSLTGTTSTGSDADIGKMLVTLALRSGQLPG